MPGNHGRIISFVEAIREAMSQEMARNPDVIIIGEGVPDPKGIFGSTLGLREMYGGHRVFDMPLSENGLTGVCIGAALNGIRPILIHQRIDFTLLSFDQLINNAAKWFYMFNQKAAVPLTIRMVIGRGWGQGPQHSQSIYGMFAQVPGLKVIMPTTPFDAKGMMISAIRDDNPVLIVEHRWLHSIKGSVPTECYSIDISKAEVKVVGDENTLTIASLSYSVIECLEVARLLRNFCDISIEVIDLKTVNPLDKETVISSVKKTKRLLVVEPASEAAGIGGNLVAQVVAEAFSDLILPPVRLSLPNHPCPTSPYLSSNYYPNQLSIIDICVQILEINIRHELWYSELVEKFEKNPRDTPDLSFLGPF